MLNAEIITQVLLSTGLFIIVWIVVGNNLFKPYLALLDEREAKTSGAEREAESLQEQAVKQTAQLNAELRQARVKGIAVRDEYVREAKQTAQEIVDNASEAANLELEKNRHLIDELTANTRADVPRESEKLAGMVVDRVLASGGSRSIH